MGPIGGRWYETWREAYDIAYATFERRTRPEYELIPARVGATFRLWYPGLWPWVCHDWFQDQESAYKAKMDIVEDLRTATMKMGAFTVAIGDQDVPYRDPSGQITRLPPITDEQRRAATEEVKNYWDHLDCEPPSVIVER